MNKIQILPVGNKYTRDGQVISHEPLLKSEVWRKSPEQLQHSRLLEAFRQCDRCPLGAKTKVIMHGKQETTINIPSVCSFYEKHKTICPVDKLSYVQIVKEYYSVIDTPQYTEELGKYLMQNIISDAAISRDVDMIEKGRPGFITNKHNETAVRLFDSIVKLKTGGDKHLHLHSENLAEQIVDGMFNDVVDIKKDVKDKQTTLGELNGI